MKVVNPQLLRVNGSYFDMRSNLVPTDSAEEFSRELTKPARFLFENGVFSNLETAVDDLFWSVNIKKGLIDMLQVDSRPRQSMYMPGKLMPGLPVHYSDYEDGIRGLCKTSYTRLMSKSNYSGSEASALNITKVRNYEDCVTDSAMYHHNFDQVGCPSENDRAQNPLFDSDSEQLKSEEKYKCYHKIGKNSPLEQFSTYRYNITLNSGSPMIEGIINVGKIVADSEGSDLITETQQTLQLVGVSRGRMPSVYFNPKTTNYNSLSYKIWDPMMDKKPFLDIPYLYLFSYPEQSQLVNAAAAYIDQIVSEMAKTSGKPSEVIPMSSKAAYNLGRLVEVLSFLDHEHLYQVFQNLKTSPAESLGSPKRQLFLDVITYAGTNHVALLVEKLISEQLVTNFEARNMVEGLPRNLYHPARDTVEKYFDLVQELHRSRPSSDVLVPVALSWAKMVSSLCSNSSTDEQLRTRFAPNKMADQFSDPRFNRKSLVRHGFDYHCSEQDIEKYSRTVFQWLKDDSNLNLKIVWGQTLVYFSHKIPLDMLMPYITGSPEALQTFMVSGNEQKSWEEFNFFRTSLVYALHNIVSYQSRMLRSISLPIFLNTNEAYELRLAAFTVFMASNPEKHEVESVASILRFEKNQEVMSMARSVIVNYSKLTSPCHHRIASIARHVLSSLPPSTPEDEDHSRAEWNEHYFSTPDFGVSLDQQYVASNVSYLPRAGYLNFGSTWALYRSKWFTFAFQQKGFHNVSFAGSNRPGPKRFSDLFNSKFFGIDEPVETPRAKIFVKLFEKTSLFVMDRQSAREAVHYLENRLSEMENSSNGGKTMHLVKVLLPNIYRAVLPSDLGLPVFVHQNHPIIIVVNVDNPVVRTSKSGHKLEISARLTPFIHYRSMKSLQTINSGIHEATGAYSVKKAALNVSTDVRLGLDYGMFEYSISPTLKRVNYEQGKTFSFVSSTEVGVRPDQSLIVSKTSLGE